MANEDMITNNEEIIKGMNNIIKYIDKEMYKCMLDAITSSKVLCYMGYSLDKEFFNGSSKITEKYFGLAVIKNIIKELLSKYNDENDESNPNPDDIIIREYDQQVEGWDNFIIHSIKVTLIRTIEFTVKIKYHIKGNNTTEITIWDMNIVIEKI